MITSINEWKNINENNNEKYSLYIFLDSPYKWGKGWTGSNDEYEVFKTICLNILKELHLTQKHNDYDVIAGINNTDIIQKAYLHPMEFVIDLTMNDPTSIDFIKTTITNNINTLNGFHIKEMKLKQHSNNEYTIIESANAFEFHKDDISDTDDVLRFFKFLYTEYNLSFHPDDDFYDYTDSKSNALFNTIEGRHFNELMEKCFFVCAGAHEDIYDLAMSVHPNKEMFNENATAKKEHYILIKNDDIIDSFTDKAKALEAFNKHPKKVARWTEQVALFKLVKETKYDRNLR